VADHLATLQGADPSVPEGLHDRAADCWRPLLAIAEAAGGKWPDRARKAAQTVEGASPEEADIATELLKDSAEVLNPEPPDTSPVVNGYIKTEALLTKLHEMADRPWPTFGKKGQGLTSHKLGELLSRFRIASAGQLKFPDGSRVRAYREE
jgi:hypothetical protein